MKENGRFDEALISLKKALPMSPTGHTAEQIFRMIRDINVRQGGPSDLAHLNDIIQDDPSDLIAIYFRGLEFLTQGRFEDAKKDIDEAYKLGLKVHEVRANKAYVRFMTHTPFSREGIQAYFGLEDDLRAVAVSYTHLTLPTILLV